MAMSEGQAWVLIITSIFAGITGLLTIIFQQLNRSKDIIQRDRVEAKVDQTRNEVRVVKKNTDGTLGESLRIGMISAHLLASQKTPPVPEHAKLAEEAAAKYAEHQRQMKEAECPDEAQKK